MALVVIVPLLASLALAWLRIDDARETADRYEGFRRSADASRTASSLALALSTERDLTIDPRQRAASNRAKLDEARAETDTTARDFQGELAALPPGTGMEGHRAAIRDSLGRLTALRAAADQNTPTAEIQKGYGALVLSVSGVHNQVTGAGKHAQGTGWTLYTIGLNGLMVADQRAMLSAAEKAGKIDPAQSADVAAAQLVREITGNEFAFFADEHELARYRRIAASDDAKTIEQTIATLRRTDLRNPVKSLPRGWYEAMTRVGDDLASLRTQVENRVVATAEDQRNQARDRMRTDIVVAGVILLAGAAVAVLTSRRLVRGLRSLRSSATTVADQYLPQVAGHLRQGTALPAELETKALGIRSREEIGDVARAFDRVYLEAVRLGRAQAELREDVNAVFRNLSRRNQNLVQRQLAVLTELESREPDSRQLSRLFQLDHLSARIRRNSENLLVLAGAEIGSRRSADLSALDLVRTAVSEIEQYERVACRTMPGLCVAGYAANDLVHLTAELLDNAVSFSSPDTQVSVSGQRLPDGRLLMEIRDMGIGMDEGQLRTAHDVLRATVGTRVDVSETMGLFVVGTLARKHGVEVRLHANTPSGLVAAVIIPKSVVGATVPEHPAAAVPQPAAVAVPPQPYAPVSAAYGSEPAHERQRIPAQPEPADRRTPAPAPASAPDEAGVTGAGLPVRRPRSRSGRMPKRSETPPPGGTASRPSPDELRARMSGLQAGIASATGGTGTTAAARPGGPERTEGEVTHHE